MLSIKINYNLINSLVLNSSRTGHMIINIKLFTCTAFSLVAMLNNKHKMTRNRLNKKFNYNNKKTTFYLCASILKLLNLFICV